MPLPHPQEFVPPLQPSQIVSNTLKILRLALRANWAIISQLQTLAQPPRNAFTLQLTFARDASQAHTLLTALPALNAEIMV